MKLPKRIIFLAVFVFLIQILTAAGQDRVKTAEGLVEGTGRQDSGVRIFRGIPFAQPPVGAFRWREPQKPKKWKGVRKATDFGPRCMQQPVFSDMVFRSDGLSEDCLYLNVWTPAEKKNERRPVLVYFYGGGFIAGDGSELRYDGESMATRGIVAVTLSYRLGPYGFLAHPELTKESPHKASGNYGLLDQAAAIDWVRRNIAAFGGDPGKITIAGESAGSFSVSAQMASPLSKNLISSAIGESGSVLSHPAANRIVPLAEAEKEGEKFAKSLGAETLKDLRALTTEQIQEATKNPWKWRFPLAVDGYFFPESPLKIYAEGRQSHVPLLVGWNSEESNWRGILGDQEPNPENYEAALKKLYGEKSAEVLKLYPGETREEVIDSATALAGDRFIGYSTWKWFDMHVLTGDSPVYRYFYARPRPALNADKTAPTSKGAVHSAEIEYAMGNLATNKVFAWTPDDYKVSEVMQGFFANFIKTGNPNGTGLPDWPAAEKGKPFSVMRIDVESGAETATGRDRYLFLDKN